MIFGIVLADRLVRDRKLGVAELLDSTPTHPGPRLVAKYLGVCAATAVPVALLYVAVALAFMVWRAQPAALWWGLATGSPADTDTGAGLSSRSIIQGCPLLCRRSPLACWSVGGVFRLASTLRPL
jgi:hypothetical protein